MMTRLMNVIVIDCEFDADGCVRCVRKALSILKKHTAFRFSTHSIPHRTGGRYCNTRETLRIFSNKSSPSTNQLLNTRS